MYGNNSDYSDEKNVLLSKFRINSTQPKMEKVLVLLVMDGIRAFMIDGPFDCKN